MGLLHILLIARSVQICWSAEITYGEEGLAMNLFSVKDDHSGCMMYDNVKTASELIRLWYQSGSTGKESWYHKLHLVEHSFLRFSILMCWMNLNTQVLKAGIWHKPIPELKNIDEGCFECGKSAIFFIKSKCCQNNWFLKEARSSLLQKIFFLMSSRKYLRQNLTSLIFVQARRSMQTSPTDFQTRPKILRTCR